METKKKWFTASNIFTAVIFLLIAALIINPQIKGTLMQGLMKIGLFQPEVPSGTSTDSGSENTEQQASTSSVSFKDESGAIVPLNSLHGKVVFINFWATWCPPCVAEMPSINDLYTKLKTNPNVVILMVDVDNKAAQSQEFMHKNKYSLPVFTPASAIPPDYLGSAIPTTVVLNKAGKIVFRHEGGADYTNPEFLAYLEKLSKE
ncbi:TlpA family protein disulfide reductase [Pedobacter antarcticus]|uniref:TlpA family protein disulfide reductase n=1 Tax=Pedobacter antarcticus TaxID=34086 RepID=UPI001C595F0A|nr:TlpA disulfide reductase family protein [Pedobacter antarcticus]